MKSYLQENVDFWGLLLWDESRSWELWEKEREGGKENKRLEVKPTYSVSDHGTSD